MDEKASALADLRRMYDHWKGLATRLREPELTAELPGGMSVKDMMAHLAAWQAVSIARLEAAQWGREPEYPAWTDGDPDDEARTEVHNARIYEANRARPWPEVHRAWREGYLRFMALAEATPAADLTDRGKYPWLNGFALIDVVRGSEDHHREHLEGLV